MKQQCIHENPSFYIGIMTGNSMDAIDVVYAQINQNQIQPIHTHSIPFTQDMQQQTVQLRELVKTCPPRNLLEQNPLFISYHTSYIQQISKAVVELIQQNHIDVSSIKAICSHGKTLAHCPSSINPKTPYTLQIGSGKMLANLIARATNYPYIRVIYDFRSDDVLNAGEGAPLIPPLNAFIARQDNCYNRIDINAGNTSNLCVIQNGTAVAGWDIGPCNEYMDFLIRTHTNQPFDIDGNIGQQGQLDTALLKELFQINGNFYMTIPPRSGDPAHYNTQRISAFKNKENLPNLIYTCAYFAAYIIVHSFQFIQGNIPNHISLFGGGWKHPILYHSLSQILTGKGFILPEHQLIFQNILERIQHPVQIQKHPFSQWMESLLWAKMGYCYDYQIPWTTPQLTNCRKPTICGIEAVSDINNTNYNDCICRSYPF